MPSVLETFLLWLESSSMAELSVTSPLITSGLSSVHLLGVVLIGGAAIITGLHSCGVLFGQRPLAEIVRPAIRIVLLGLSISVITGVLQFVPRAVTAAGNSYFQLKFLMLLAALACYLLLYRRVTRPRSQVDERSKWTRFLGVVGSLLWIGVVVAGSAFILLE